MEIEQVYATGLLDDKPADANSNNMSATIIEHEIVRAQNDIAERLNLLELAIGRPVTDIDLAQIDITTIGDEARRYMRTVRIFASSPLGHIGREE